MKKSLSTKKKLIPSKYLEKILKQAEKDIKAGKNLSPMFTDIKKGDDYLAGL